MAYLFKIHFISTGQNSTTSEVQMWALSITSKAVTLYNYTAYLPGSRNKPGTTSILYGPGHYQVDVFFQLSHSRTTWALPCRLPDGGSGVLGN